jgi:hypothetical protein
MTPAEDDAAGRRPVLLAVLAVLLAAAAVTLTRAAPPATSAPPAVAAGRPVTHTELGCPRLTAERGTTTVRRVGHARGLVSPVSGRAATEVRATGAAAVGLFGARTDQSSRTLAVAGCVAPRAEWWFTGAGAGLDHTSTLLVANLDPGPAVVDLRVLGPDGPVRTVATTGIVVAPGGRRRFDLADLAPETDDLALEVHAVRGRVAASVADGFRRGATGAAGQEWLPSATRPARTLWLGGLPAVAERRTLLVANPTDLEAVVEVAVSGTSGTFAPTGAHTVDVAPGGVASLDLTRVVTGRRPVGVRVRSDRPVLAAVRSVGARDHSVAGPVTPLTGPAAALLLPGAVATLQVTAPSGGAVARVEVYDGRGRRVSGRQLRPGAGATVTWSPTPSDRGAGAAYVVLTPERGKVQGAVTYAGRGVSATPLVDLPLREPSPVVQPGPG